MAATALVTRENISSVLIFIVVFLLIYLSTRKPTGIPPGPQFTVPLIGDLFSFIGGDLLVTFQKMRHKHGDIFSLYFGKELMIVINGYTLIHRAAVINGELFTGRPEMLMNEFTGGRKGVILTDGPFWKRQRKFTHRSLQEFGFGKSLFENKILQEVECFISFLKDQDGRPIDIRKTIHASVANVVFSIVSGKRHDYGHKGFQKLLKDSELAANQILKVSMLLRCAPFLKHVPGDLLNIKLLTNNLKDWTSYFRKMYMEHLETIEENCPRDFFDIFIMEMSKENNPDFTFEQLSATARDLFGAGAETTATTIRWAVLYLLKHEDIKTRLQSDVDKVVHDNQFPHLGDMAKLPYVEAFIMEVLRCADIAPLAVPHCVMENDVLFEGYRIPKDTPIMFNLDSVLKDPHIFENPHEFNPERFLDAEGTLVRPKEFIPFGIGRRVCLGEAVAKMELFLFLTSLIKYFDFEFPDDNAEPDFVGVLGITRAPKPFEIRATRRTATHENL